VADVVIKTRENGPLLVTGPFRLIDHTGAEYDVSGQANVALCRCGQSNKKPFCDGTHRTCGFVAEGLATYSQPQERQRLVSRPQQQEQQQQQ
jgi:CDGSH-type Zn-finger protein